MHVRVWKFLPPEDREAAFATAYSASGPWAELFRQSPGYRGTSLLKPTEKAGWWMTVDRWETLSDFEAFNREHGEKYRALDLELEGVAGVEEFVGAFEEDQ